MKNGCDCQKRHNRNGLPIRTVFAQRYRRGKLNSPIVKLPVIRTVVVKDESCRFQTCSGGLPGDMSQQFASRRAAHCEKLGRLSAEDRTAERRSLDLLAVPLQD